jgi:hypothetical protein
MRIIEAYSTTRNATNKFKLQTNLTRSTANNTRFIHQTPKGTENMNN